MIVVALIGLGLLTTVIVMFMGDVRLIRRRQPIKYWFSNTIVYPDDSGYWLCVFYRVMPYSLIGFLILLIVVAEIWSLT